MERLENALAKARRARRQVQARVAPADRRVEYTPVGNWAELQSLEISPRIAARQRLGALMGAEASAPYDVLRARVQRQLKQSGWRRLAITSPNKACGKTTIGANLALSLARQPELRVILMDFDLRRPTLAEAFGCRDRRNIADLLQGRVDFAGHALRYGKNLAICTNRTPVSQSAEILHSQATGALIDRIEAEWQPDLMIFDLPPMLGTDDTLGFLSHADCVLLVGAAGSTTLNQIDACERELSNLSNVVGTVLNKCRYLDDADGYGYEAY